MTIDGVMAWTFLGMVPISLVAFVGFSLRSSLDERVFAWLQGHSKIWMVINNLAGLFTIISVSTAIGAYYLARHGEAYKTRDQYAGVLANYEAEVTGNSNLILKFIEGSEKYKSANPVWQLQTLQLERVMRSQIFPDTLQYSLFSELYRMSVQFNQRLQFFADAREEDRQGALRELVYNSKCWLKTFGESDQFISKFAGAKGISYGSTVANFKKNNSNRLARTNYLSECVPHFPKEE